MIYIYRIIYFILKTVIILTKPLLDSKLKSQITLRSKKLDKIKSFNKTYWFHASSGEIEYCKSVIRLLKEQQPEAQIVVTYSSPSAEKLFYNITSYVDQFIALGWDQPIQIRELIDYINPKVLIFSKTDLWPELIYQTKKKNIRIGVISFNPRINFYNKWLLKNFDLISCIDNEVKNKLQQELPRQNISADGDTRFDQVFYRLEQEPKLKINSNSKIFICGSTWPEDERILLETFSDLTRKNIKIILSPHEVGADNIVRVQKELLQRQLSSQILSNELDFQHISLEKDVLIIDKIGYLADAYRFADIAFVGGSFKEKIHSVMEPLCCGLPVITGPYYQNNLEAVKYLNKYVFATNDSEEIISSFNKLLNLSKEEILNELNKNRNACKKIVNLIQTRL